jgi:3-methyladenine DNA glycosylase AlkD
MARLEALGSEQVREVNTKNGAQEAQFGVKMGDIRTIAKEIKTDHSLGLELWKTGNLDAMFLATLVVKPKQLSNDQIESMTKTLSSPTLPTG